jgi:hypothetical protein
MHPTLFPFSVDRRSMLALEMTTAMNDFIPSEPWKTGYSANDADDPRTSSLDSYWIDLGGEG